MYAGGGQTIESTSGGVQMHPYDGGASQIRTYLAKGGITRGLAIAGESGEEAVIPLTDERAMDKLRQGLGGGAPTVINDNSRLVINLPPGLSAATAQSIARSEIQAFEARKAQAALGARRGSVR
jgi:hypothetical protein